jgi:hypothetical protein
LVGKPEGRRPRRRWWDNIKMLLKEQYRRADKSLARPTSRCVLFGGENISFDASLVIKVKVKQSLYRPGVAQSVPGS